ncbi:hypothetical protein [Nostoc sp.]|uniref:hypothetical protein n=1 Tax=Nostoc sp. TaxID=1180 RepID=UPI002FF84C1E
MIRDIKPLLPERRQKVRAFGCFDKPPARLSRTKSGCRKQNERGFELFILFIAGSTLPVRLLLIPIFCETAQNQAWPDLGLEQIVLCNLTGNRYKSQIFSCTNLYEDNLGLL